MIFNFMHKIIIFISVILFLTVAKAERQEKEEVQNNYTEVSSFKEIKSIITDLLQKRNASKTLIVMPLERVMIRPIAEAFKKQDDNYRPLFKKAFDKVLPSQRLYFDEVILVEYQNELTDESIPSFISEMQAYQAPVIVMTSNISGSYNQTPYLEVWTVNFLKKLNIDLNKGSLANKTMILNSMTKVRNNYPTFYKGLLSCNSENNKNSYHQVLATFLANSKFLPDTVIMIHFDPNTLNIMGPQLKSLKGDIEFVGLLYNPPVMSADSMDPNAYFEFMLNFAQKVNKVKRKTDIAPENNPYEQKEE